MTLMIFNSNYTREQKEWHVALLYGLYFLLVYYRVELIQRFRMGIHEITKNMGEAWKIFLIVAGRGFGKTYASSQHMVHLIQTSNKPIKIGLIGMTLEDTRDIMVEGDSGILYQLNKSKIAYKYTSSRHKIIVKCNGNIHEIKYFSSVRPHKLRGYEFDYIWVDELCHFTHSFEILQQIELCLRRGKSRCFISTTPRDDIPSKKYLIRELRGRNDVLFLNGSSFDNERLSKKFQLYAHKIKQTTFGKQEIFAKSSNKFYNWKESDIVYREAPLECDIYRLGIDIATGHGTTGLILTGIKNGKFYILDDLSVSGAQNHTWIDQVELVYKKYVNLEILYEKNQGGYLIEQILRLRNIFCSIIPIFSYDHKKNRLYFTNTICRIIAVYFAKPLQNLVNEMLYQRSFDRVDALANCLYNVQMLLY